MKKMIDYKGKYFTLQDTVDETDSWQDIEIGEMDENKITDTFLRLHIKQCIYYGIPAYTGKDKELNERVKKLEQEISLENY